MTNAQAGGTGNANDAKVSTVAELDEALKAARLREWERGPDRAVEAAERSVAKAEAALAAAKDGLAQAKKERTATLARRKANADAKAAAEQEGN